jgi:hypothetical protein
MTVSVVALTEVDLTDVDLTDVRAIAVPPSPFSSGISSSSLHQLPSSI